MHAQVTITRSIAASSDDAEEAGPDATGTHLPGHMDRTSSDIELVRDFDGTGGYSGGTQKIGLRFTTLSIPPGSIITSAYLTFRAVAADVPMSNAEATNLTIRGHLTPNAPTFPGTNGDISARALSASSVSWVPTAWINGTDYNSPSIVPVIQEIVNQGGWTSGNAIAIIITGTGHRSSQAYDTDPATAPQLTVTYATYQISGTVFEDVNYGGGAGRNLATAIGSGGTGRSGARVELFDSGGNYVTSTTTAAGGTYSFTGLSAGTFTIRVVKSTVSSSRAGYVANTHLAVQTFRTNASTGSAAAVTDHVGGEMPGKADAGNGSTTLAALTTATTTAQTVIPVAITTADITGADAGFSFDVVANTNDAGQGSLRQFILNANALSNTGLALQGQTAGRDVALFMISDGIAHPGTNAGMANLLTTGVAKINLASGLPAITETVSISGNVQTSLIGNTNPGLVGTGGFVGVDNIPFAQFNKPEVEVNGGDNTAFTINGNASDVLLEGMSVINAGTGVSVSSGTGTANTLRAMFLGADAQGVDPGGVLRNTAFGVTYASPASGTVEYCLAAYNGQSGISAAQPSASVTITGNEAVGNNWNSNSHDGLDVDGVNCIVRFNLSHHNVTSSGLPNGGGGNGIEMGSTVFVGNMNNLVENNTIHDNTSQGITIRSGAGGNTIRKNVIHSNHIGVLICREGSTSANNVITENSIHGNNTLGIDLSNAASGGDGVTVNDLNDADVGSNGLLNFPVLTSAMINGGNLVLTGQARPGSLIEFFLSDNDPGGFGEGLAWSLSATEGTADDADATSGSYGPGAINGLLQGTDNTERFSFTVPLPVGVVNGTKLTATGTIAGNTSEFSGIVTVFEDLDLDNDGIPNSAEVGDCDGDGVPNNLDLDSDNDGIYDCVESGVNAPQTGGVLNGATTPNGIPVSADTNGDGTIDYALVDSDGDATLDSCELDADADGCTDVIEAGYTDANGDGSLGPAPLTVDSDGLVTSGNN